VKLLPYEVVIVMGDDAITITSSENILNFNKTMEYEFLLDVNAYIRENWIQNWKNLLHQFHNQNKGIYSTKISNYSKNSRTGENEVEVSKFADDNKATKERHRHCLLREKASQRIIIDTGDCWTFDEGRLHKMKSLRMNARALFLNVKWGEKFIFF
jgi:hypothetical protein